KTLPVVLGYGRALGKTRERLAVLFAPAGPLPSESVEQIREILDELAVHTLIDAEINAQRGSALHALQGIAPIAAASEPADLRERDALARHARVVGDEDLVATRRQVNEGEVAGPVRQP